MLCVGPGVVPALRVLDDELAVAIRRRKPSRRQSVRALNGAGGPIARTGAFVPGRTVERRLRITVVRDNCETLGCRAPRVPGGSPGVETRIAPRDSAMCRGRF